MPHRIAAGLGVEKLRAFLDEGLPPRIAKAGTARREMTA